MNKVIWNSEVKRFVSMSAVDKSRWLSSLMYWITLLARDTYVAGSNSIRDPVRMRRFNELAHRVASQMQELANGTNGIPDEEFADGVGLELAAVQVDLDTLAGRLRHQ